METNGSAAQSQSRSAAGRRIRGLDADQRRAQRRELILDAAFELIAANGYVNTSIEQICQTAYVGNKAFYESFGSKEDCYIALLKRVSEQIQSQVVAVLAADDLSDEERTIRVLTTEFAHALVDDPRIATVTFGEASGISPNVERQRRANRRWAAGFLEALWRRFDIIDDGHGGIDYRQIAVATIGGMFDSVADWLHDMESHDPHAVDELVANLTAFTSIVRDGIAAQRGRRAPSTS